MKDTGIRAAAARSLADKDGLEVSEAGGEPAVAGVRDGGSSSEIARGSVDGEASEGGLLASAVRIVIFLVDQSIDGLCQNNQE